MGLNRKTIIAAAALALGAGIVLGALAGRSDFRKYAPAAVARAEQGGTDPFASALGVQEAFRAISAEVLPSIVEISVKSATVVDPNDSGEVPWNDFFLDPSEESEGPRYFQSHGLGSGVIVDRRGSTYYVLTNAHVVGEAEEINLLLNDGSERTAELAGRDVRKDLAVLVFDDPEHRIAPVRIGDSDRLYVGDWVLAFGSPYGYEQSVSSGIVSALGRRDGPGDNINDFIQTDASINQGNSGGALVNIRGELVGINTFITTPNRGSIGLGFAIPVNNALSALNQIIESGAVRYGWLGVSLGAYGDEAADSLGYSQRSGVLVYQVYEGSPAQAAGLRPGDLVTALDGRPSPDNERLVYRIGDKAPGDVARFTVERFGRSIEIAATMGERPDEEAVRAMHEQARPGFVPAPMTDDLAAMMELDESVVGVPVAEVYPRTPAQALDLRPGDLILEVEGREVGSLKDLYVALADSDSDPSSYTVFRGGETLVLEKRP